MGIIAYSFYRHLNIGKLRRRYFSDEASPVE